MLFKSLTLFLAFVCVANSAMANDLPHETSVKMLGAPSASSSCRVGIYQSDSRQFVSVTLTQSGFRYTFSDGTIGEVEEEQAQIQCLEDSILTYDGEIWPRVELVETDTEFQSGDTTLSGRLIEPTVSGDETPLVVYAHGSERSAWIGRSRDPYQMAGRGISVFVYDKRGTGASKGEYSQNIPQLAQDLAAAAREAKRLADGRFNRFGFIGLSQGGWVAPMASLDTEVDFIGVGYGLAVDIPEEDASQVAQHLLELGFGVDVMTKARELTDITARIVQTDFAEGLDELAAFRARHATEPWMSQVEGGYTGILLSRPMAELRERGVPEFDGLNVDWSHDPLEVLRKVTVPQLWVLAEADREAPIAETIERLQTLRSEGKEIDILVFPDTDHGIWEFEEGEDRSRNYTRIAPGFYEAMADWAKGRFEGPYGRATGR